MNNLELAESQLQIQNQLLAQIAQGQSLATILAELVEAIEQTLDETIFSVVLLQPNNKLQHSSAPNLPEAYKEYYQTIDKAALQDDSSPCARAVLGRQQIIIPDITASSLSEDYQNTAISNGLYACWSSPIFGSNSKILGAFVVYYQTRRSPQDDDIEMVLQLANIASIAIERHQREEQKCHQEALFSKVQQVAHVGNWTFDLATQTITWSPEMFSMYGLAGRTVAPSYEEYLQMLPEETSQHLQQLVGKALATGEPYTIEYSFVRPDGNTKYHECRAEVEYDAQGKVQRLIGTSLDITERRKSELALQNLVAGTALTGKDFFAALVQHIAEALGVAHAIVTEKVGNSLVTLGFWADSQLMPTYKYALAHTPCEHVFQLREFFCNHNVQERFPLDADLVELEAESYLGIALVNSQDREIGHLYILHKQAIANPSWAKQVLQVFAARAAAELERQQAETTIKQQLAAMEAAVDGISLLRDGIYIYANQAHLSLFGYDSAEDLIGRSWLALHPSAEAQRMQTEVLPLLELEQAWQGEAIAVRKDGSTFTGEISWTMTEGGLLIQVYRDISERKQAEHALKNLIRGTATSTGKDFFPALTRHIATALNVSYAIVSEYKNKKLNTLAFWANGELQPNLIYNPVQTPCELTLQQGQYYCEHSVQQRFPEDNDLVEMNAHSYLGIALKDSQGQSIGDLCILHQDKILSPYRAEQILQVFAARAGAEVERLRADAANKRQLEAMEAAIDGISILQDGQYLYANQAYLELFGYGDMEELVGQNWRSLYAPEEIARLENQVIPMLKKKRAWQGEAIATRKDGSSFAQGLSLTLTEDNLLISVCRDISELKQAQALITHNALHDPLTKLPNRTLLLERLGLAIQRAKRNNNYNYAVLFLDLDRFKVINDSLGHTVGDQLLVAIAQKLKTHLRKTDLVARLGGDEFLILLEDFHNIDDVIYIAERMLADCQTPLTINEHQIFTGMSIGIALGNKDYDQAGELIRDADIAMYRAKSQENNSYKFFDTAMHAQALRRLNLEADLRKAIKQQEFTVYYQPIMDMSRNQLVGFEALVRWQHPERGLISPQEFIPIAEEIGFIVNLDRWVLEAACQQIKYWRQTIPSASALKVSVNLSAQDLRKTTLLQDVNSILRKTQLSGCALTLEITESMLITDIDQTINLLTQLAARDIQISIDDFGTGYSSLNYLHRFPVNNLKIDQSFVSQMQSENRNYKVVETILTLSNQLGLTTVAEGIETQGQLEHLRKLGCRLGQGYLFSKPLPAKDIEALFFQTNTFPDCQAS